MFSRRHTHSHPRRTNRNSKPLARRPVIGIDSDGKEVTASVEAIHSARARILTLRTGGKTLLTTADHPVKLTGGDFHEAGDLVHGAFIDTFENGSLSSRMVEAVSEDAEDRQVFNLSVSEPHVFIASGFVVHNKGGGALQFFAFRLIGRLFVIVGRFGWIVVIFTYYFPLYILFKIIRKKSKPSKNREP